MNPTGTGRTAAARLDTGYACMEAAPPKYNPDPTTIPTSSSAPTEYVSALDVGGTAGRLNRRNSSRIGLAKLLGSEAGTHSIEVAFCCLRTAHRAIATYQR